jgi:hypothetical protein
MIEPAKVRHGSLYCRATVSRHKYGVEKTVDTHTILINAIKCCLSSRNMIDKTMSEVLWSFISDFYVNLRVELGKHPQVILSMYYLSWTRLMSVPIGWPI